jgi:hypothetical protein
MMNDKTEPAATTTKTWDMTLELVLEPSIAHGLNVRKAAHENNDPRPPGQVDMLHILDSLLCNRHDVCFGAGLVVVCIMVVLDTSHLVLGRHGAFSMTMTMK